MQIHPLSTFQDYEIAPGVIGYQTVEVTADPEESGLAYKATATVEARSGRYVVTKLTVEEAQGGPSIQRGELAKISVEPFIRAAASTVLRETPADVPGQSDLSLPGPTQEFYARVARAGLTEADLSELAHLYRLIRLQEGKPTAVLATALNLSTATVKRWLTKAVEAGHLTQEERTK